MTIAFTNKRSQGIRLPAELRLPGIVKRTEVWSGGCERIIAPVGQPWDSFFPSLTDVQSSTLGADTCMVQDGNICSQYLFENDGEFGDQRGGKSGAQRRIRRVQP